MKNFERVLWLAVACFAGLIGYGFAQTRGTALPAAPDPTHVSFVLAKDMKWEGTGGQDRKSTRLNSSH